MIFKDKTKCFARCRSVALSALLVITIASITAYLVNETDETWATIDQLHAEWDPVTRSLRVSIAIDKRKTCLETPVAKSMLMIDSKGGVVPKPIPLNGHLPEKLQQLPIGRHIVFDIAKPRARSAPGEALEREIIEPGRYVLTLIAGCEQPPTDHPNQRVTVPSMPGVPPSPPSRPVLSTGPVQAAVIVPEIKVRLIPPEQRMYQPQQRARAQP